MVEVDLRLFVTCRLCLDVKGHFQIDPTVQHQIKYCFDIDVEPFDGLPQLICKKCENILREHYAIKKSFIEKQTQFKTKLQVNARKGDKSPSPQQNESDNCIFIARKADKSDNCKESKGDNKPSSKLEDSDSSNFKDVYPEESSRKKKKARKKRIVNRLTSSSEDLEPNDLPEKHSKANPNKYSSKDSLTWDASFSKYFVCRICSEGFQDKQGITKHIKKHNNLLIKYKNIFKLSCLVVMDKSDNKPNICNSKKTVVYSSDSIMQNTHNPLYYIWYHPKTYSENSDTTKTVSKKNLICESTDDENLTPKRRRLLSRSSSETVVINRDSEHEGASHVIKVNTDPPTVIDCIDLDDSSDNESCDSNEKSGNFPNKRKLDSKSTENIIKMCHSKYTKQLDSLERNAFENDRGKVDFLQHKVLSIGRKIINNKGFACTGLLRFLENKDLSVIWKERSIINARNDGKYVRIATRVRGNESSDTNNAEWKFFKSIVFEHNATFPSPSVLKKLKSFKNFNKKPKSKSIANNVENSDSVENLPRISSVYSRADLEITKIDPENLLLKKLLNENPVSNPKQLPKKVVNNNECSTKTMKVFSAPNTLPVGSKKQMEENKNANVNTMPIVTSIVSLAHAGNKEKNVPSEDSISSVNGQQTYPRIKVKPVSELMPDKTITNINSKETNVNGAQNVMWPSQTGFYKMPKIRPAQSKTNVHANKSQIWQNQMDTITGQHVWSNPNVPSSDQHSTVSTDEVPQSSEVSDGPMEYVLLDTVEFPNTKTSSPFQYLKNLLLVHNIILADTDQPLPAGSISLIKLKLVYQQEKCLPITLCLTLFCLKNMFCIQVRDMNMKDVNVNNLSANWQWQLLKIYNNDVINKILQTAAKISVDTYRYTQQFFSLLKSIKAKNNENDTL